MGEREARNDGARAWGGREGRKERVESSRDARFERCGTLESATPCSASPPTARIAAPRALGRTSRPSAAVWCRPTYLSRTPRRSPGSGPARVHRVRRHGSPTGHPSAGSSTRRLRGGQNEQGDARRSSPGQLSRNGAALMKTCIPSCNTSYESSEGR